MKNTISIHYDLRTPGRNYEALYTAIRNTGSTWAHPLESMWVVMTTKSAAQVRDIIAAHVDRNDQLLVADFGPDWASLNLSKEINDWLKANAG